MPRIKRAATALQSAELVNVHIKSSAQRRKVTSLAIMKILALTLFTCYIAAVGGLLTSHVVVFGDSYSDNGDGFAKYARFVLRTNSVSTETLFTL